MIENTLNYIEQLIEVRVDSIKTEFDTLLRSLRQLKHCKINNKWFILEKVLKNTRVEKKEEERRERLN